MVGLLPKRTRMHIPTAWLSPLRYWYELSVPFFALRRPPVLSTCWLISKRAYEDLGGFQAVTRSVLPEAYFARVLHDKHKYQFIRSSDALQVQTEKSLSEQYQTAIRTRYPQVGKRLERQMVVICLLVWISAGTFLATPYLILRGNWLGIVALFGSILLIAGNTILTKYTSPKALFLSIFTMPILLVQEIVLFLISGYKYEFSEVTWKDRNICYPVMHISRELPKLDG